MGGILSGVFTPTESAAIAVVYCLILGFVYRSIKVADLPEILLNATKTTAIAMLLVGVSTALSWVMLFARIPDLISDALLGLTESPTVILILMMVILLLLGTARSMRHNGPLILVHQKPCHELLEVVDDHSVSRQCGP
ncbi:TRAP transporter large permease subunit [Vibrio cholerae]|nr:TRAP transporter large permease subunit [Vibrio cholerae]